MIATCKCPLCRGKFLVEICIECLEELSFKTEDEAKKYILENVKIKTVHSDEMLIESVRSVLKTSIPDETLYNEIIKNLRPVFEAHI